MDRFPTDQPDPEHQAYSSELGRVLEAAVDALPDGYRAVFMLREIEGLSTSATADALNLREEAVKTRLHRARAMVRLEIHEPHWRGGRPRLSVSRRALRSRRQRRL